MEERRLLSKDRQKYRTGLNLLIKKGPSPGNIGQDLFNYKETSTFSFNAGSSFTSLRFPC